MTLECSKDNANAIIPEDAYPIVVDSNSGVTGIPNTVAGSSYFFAWTDISVNAATNTSNPHDDDSLDNHQSLVGAKFRIDAF